MPYITVYVRLAAPLELMGDFVFKSAKVLPMYGSISSMIFNSKVLAALSAYREFNNFGKGKPIETDESHPTNAPADVFWMFVHIIAFFCILLVFIEWHLPCCCLCHMKRINEDENKEYFDH